MIEEPPELLTRTCMSRRCNGQYQTYELTHANVGVPWKSHSKYTCRVCGESVALNDRQLEVLIGSMAFQKIELNENDIQKIRSGI